MTTLSAISIVSALAVTLAGLSSQAVAGDPFDKLIGKIGKYVDLPHPIHCPTPMPYPQPSPMPYPQPAPFPQPGPGPLPSPAPAYFLGVYTSTVEVGMAGGGASNGGPQAYVVPGYGEQAYGQRINSIVPNSPAFHAGLEPGDILVNANGIALDSDQILRAAIAQSEGYLEMQVLDSRSGALVWVVAETDPQNPVPAVASNGNLNAARQAFKTKSSQQQVRSAKAGMPSRSLQRPVTPSPRQFSQTGSDGRRPPVRRR